MPNHVTNRLEINADRETVQKGKHSINSPFHSKNVILLL